jgi:hypothetical protein
VSCGRGREGGRRGGGGGGGGGDSENAREFDSGVPGVVGCVVEVRVCGGVGYRRT